MKKLALRYILYNILYFVFSLLLLHGEINSLISPFFMAFMFALVAARINIFYSLFGAAVAGLVCNFTLYGFIEITIVVLCIILLNLASKKAKGLGWLSFLGLIAASSIQFIFNATSSYSLVICVVNLVLKMVLFYTYLSLISGIMCRGTRTRLAIDEFIGLAFLIMPVAIALFKTEVFGVNLGLVFAALFIMLVTLCLGALESISVSVIIGLGVSVCRGDILMLAALPLWAASVSVVKRTGRGVMIFVLLLVDIILGVYFNVYPSYNGYNLIALGVACIILIVIPRKKLLWLKRAFSEEGLELSPANLFKMEEGYFLSKIKKMSALFYEIHSVYDNLVMGSLNKNEMIKSIKHNIIQKNCMGCVKRSVCYDKSLAADNAIGELVKLAVNKNKARVVDIPIFLASNCGKANQIMFATNAYLDEFNKFNLDIKREDEGKLMVSNQLLGVSDILNQFVAANLYGERASREREQCLIDELLYNNIIIKECVIFTQNRTLNRAIIVIRNNLYKKEQVVSVLSKFFKEKVEIIENRYARKSGYNIVTFAPKPRFECLVGSYRVAKGNVCGDGFSKLDLEGGKVMVTIADGKGHGPKANRLSEMALSMIEKFYKVGYSSQVIIDNVNKVLSFKGGENFSAVDVCLLNLKDGSVDFIKRGGTPTVVKRASGEAFSVCGSCLPIGLVENATTHIVTHYLSSGDIVVLSSDGVFDAFNSVENYTGFVNNIRELEVNRFSEILLKEAIRLNSGEIKDDMTVVTMRII